jgi:hypothetical protein
MESWRRKIFIPDSQNVCRGTKDPGYAINTNTISGVLCGSWKGYLPSVKRRIKLMITETEEGSEQIGRRQ